MPARSHFPFAHALLSLLVWANFLLADSFEVPRQQILGAEKPIGLGRLVRLRISPVEKTPPHLLSSGYTWKVFDGLTELDDVVDLNGSIFFGAGIDKKKLTAHCVCTHLYMVRGTDGKISEIATRTVWLTAHVQIGQPGPDPPSPPSPPTPPTPPGPDPDPAFPDGQYKLAGNTYRWAMTKVSDPTARAKGASALAASFRGLASAIAAGVDKELVKALEKAKQSNNSALKATGVDPQLWDAFGNELMDFTYALYTSKKLNSVQDLAIAWGEIANGLDKVR